MDILIINGPNLNLLGTRETAIYGKQSFEDYFKDMEHMFPNHPLTYFQSNVEGEIVNKIQEYGFSPGGIILNAAAYSHTSVAIADAISAIERPVIGVHISNIFARESFRHQDLTGAKCKGVISGLGLDGYRLAINHLLETR